MTVVSYRIYCEECTNEEVILEDEMDQSNWKITSKYQNKGICPACNDSVNVDEESQYAEQHTEVPFEQLDNIGEAGANNLREAGIVTRQDVENASDEEILDVSWVGEGGLESIRQEVK